MGAESSRGLVEFYAAARVSMDADCTQRPITRKLPSLVAVHCQRQCEATPQKLWMALADASDRVMGRRLERATY